MQIRTTDISSTSEWSSDPDMVEFDLSEALLHKAECCVKYMKQNDIHKMTIWYALGYKLYQNIENSSEDEPTDSSALIEHGGVQYVEFEPEYSLEGCHVEIFHDGDIKGVLQFKHTDDEIRVLIGDVNALRSQFDTLTEGA